MRALALAAVMALALVSVMPVTAAAPDEPEVVARLPREGDMARYEFNGTVLGICNGAVWQVGDFRRLTQDNATVRWTSQTRQMWDGETYRFAALERTFDGQVCDDFESEDEYRFASTAELHGRLPGPAFALNTANEYVYAHYYGPTYYVLGVEELHFHASECAGHAIGLVLGRTAAEAHEALRTCIGEDGFGPGLSAKWEDHATYGRTWVARFGSFAGGDGSGLLARYSPELSMPVEIQSTSHRLADGHIVEENATMTLTGWIDGDEPLAPLLGGAPALPGVPLGEWGQYGPQSSDLEPFPVRQAREALAETDTGAAYFAAHPDASLQYARYSPHYPTLDRVGLQSYVPTEEADCQQRSATQQAGASTPAADVRWLQTRWTDGTSYLYGHTQASGALVDAGIPSARSDLHEVVTGRDDGDLPDRGPQWRDLLAAEALVKNMGENGRFVVTMTAPTLPTVAWDAAGIPLDFPPWLPARGEAFTGTVGMSSWCMPGAGPDIRGSDHGLAFVDGRLAYAWKMATDISYNPRAPVPAWEHPASAFEAAGGGFDWVAAAAGLGILGLLAIAIKTDLGGRIAMAMFSRFQSGEAAGHPMRQKIMAQVKAQPGIRLPALADALGEPRPRVSYHVRMLERHDLVRVSRTWRGLVLYPKGHAGTATAGVLNRANAREVLELLRRRPASDVSSVAAELGVHKSRISRLSQDLEVAGLIIRRSAGRAMLLSLSHRGRALVASSDPRGRQRPSGA